MANNGYTQFNDTSKEVIRELRKLSGRALRAGGKVAAQAIKDNTPAKTGKLREAVGFRVKNESNGTPKLEIGFYTKKKAKEKGRAYFANPTWLEFGTKPHVITAGSRMHMLTKKKGRSNGTIVFGSKVMHPGQAPKPFIKTAVMNNIAAIRQAQEKGLSELSKRIEELTGIPDDYEIEGGEF